MSFHEVSFPHDLLGYGATGGPVWSTNVAVVSSGLEQRNQNWTAARHQYDVATMVETPADYAVLLAFFMARRGRTFGFRFTDPVDNLSATDPDAGISPLDQSLGTYGGVPLQLAKTYADSGGSYIRRIRKPVAGTLRVAVNGTETLAGGAYPWSVDTTTGVLTFTGAGSTLPSGLPITVGYAFQVPVRFDADRLPGTYETLRGIAARNITLIEVRL